MLKEIRQMHFDTAVAAFPRFRIALLLWLCGIPMRIGSGYRWYSFLFNKRVYEHRKTAEKHEAEYNLSLVKVLGCKIPEKLETRLVITEQEKRIAQEIRLKLGFASDEPVVLLHPGSGGSARDWKSERFIELAEKLEKQGLSVVVSGGKEEEILVNEIARNAGSSVKPFISTLRLKEFAAFIQTAKLFIANSTGPLHIAAAVGTPVIGFYPPIPVMSPKRWGPLTNKKKIFVPDPKQCTRCNGGTCKGNDCMDQITVHQVLDAALKLMGQR
jgi:heptosyltransferase III